MSDTILFVDDDIRVVAALQRSLYKSFQVEIAGGPADAMEAITSGSRYAVVVSDLKMPGMTGIEFLTKVEALSPDTVRILLTGHADLDTALSAVNDGHIFRFLTKPCPRETLTRALEAALEQHRLIACEKDLLHDTLMGTVDVLIEVLAEVHPAAFGRARRLRRWVRHMAIKLETPDLWQFEAAAMLAQLGCASVSSATLEKFYSGVELTAEEDAGMQSHPAIGRKLLYRVPRLQQVAQMIECQHIAYDDDSDLLPEDYLIRLGGQMLLAAIDLDRLLTLGLSGTAALAGMRAREGRYNPALLDALESICAAPDHDAGEVDMEEWKAFRPIADQVSRSLR